MKITYKQVKKIEKIMELNKYCCSKMENLHKNFCITWLEHGSMFLKAENEPGYSFGEKMKFCPFCGEKIEVVKG